MAQAPLGSMAWDSPELPEGPAFFLAGCWTLAVCVRGCQTGTVLSPPLTRPLDLES